MDIQPRTDSDKAGLREAEFEVLFNDHFTRIYTILLRVCADPPEAEDIAVEAFWRLWQRGPRRLENPAGWLYRVATRLGYNALRDRRRRLAREQRAAAELPQPEMRVTMDATIEQRQRREAVRAALAKLPPRQAQVLILRSSGLPYREIAAALGMTENSVGATLARAEKAFARLYEKGDLDDAPF